MFRLELSVVFIKKAEKLVKKNKYLEKDIVKTTKKLEINPSDKRLKSHKVIRSNGDKAFSSRVNNDLRIIWNFQARKTNILDILDIGGHSGEDRIYK